MHTAHKGVGDITMKQPPSLLSSRVAVLVTQARSYDQIAMAAFPNHADRAKMFVTLNIFVLTSMASIG